MSTDADAIWQDEAAIEIAADPASVWVLVSDVARVGEWSPVCRRVDSMGGATSPAEGVRTLGRIRAAAESSHDAA